MRRKNIWRSFVFYFMLPCMFINSLIDMSLIRSVKEENKNIQQENIKLQELNNELICKVEDLESIEPTVIEKEVNVYDERYYSTVEFMMNLIEPIKDYSKLDYFTSYKEILNKYGDGLDSPETVYDYFSEEQIRIMQRCIETETYDCPFEAKVGVACVILNRVEHDLFPTDPIDVIKSPNQFAYGRNNITDTTKLALEYAFEIGAEETNNCVGFRSDKYVENWNDWDYEYYDGYHWFYKIKE